MTATGFARVDASGRLLWANQATIDLLGQPIEPAIASLLGQVLAAGGGPAEIALSDGRQVSVTAGRGEGDELILSIAPAPVGLDAPWRRTSAVLECLSQGVMAFDRELRLVAWNRRVLELLYIDPDFPRYLQPYEAVVRHIAERGGYGPGDTNRLVAQRLDHIRNAAWPFYNERVRPDGLVIETVTLALPDGGFVTTYTDITGRKRAERELAASRELLELAIRAAREGVSQWDLRTGEVWFSPQWWGLLGYGGDDAGDPRDRWEELIHPEDREAALAMVEEIASGAEQQGRLLQRFRHRSGQTVYLDTRTIGVAGPDGEVSRIVGSHTDVTESILAAESVRAAKEEAEQALRELKEAQAQLIQSEKMAALGSLVAGVTHEISTPMGIAMTGASLLADRTRVLRQEFEKGALRKGDFADFVDTATEATQLMILNIERAARLIQSFKQVAVDQASEARRSYDLADYIHEVLRSLGLKIRRSGHSVLVSCPEGVGMDGYPGALSQVLTNFVMNSITHGFGPGQRGTLRIDIRLPTMDEVELVYSDDGRGIPRDLHGKVFEPFFTTRRGEGGSGLGLSIVYTIVTRTLGGRIRLDSTPGQGVTFTLRFPRVAPAEPEPV
ncbi:PAS-domain containing protein [Azospirillum thermophilum]|uniref:histidine kinase n=1 Tax=Azospirillum thermophilum TaxID=2202148 RepID=A0A2S2CXR6_9PROT|nr:PAS-domain containing protein [Azospirillum thermophilum]AWK89067.1 PAS domain-containing sensor histidine kinase [Azospirillum thermophilum]